MLQKLKNKLKDQRGLTLVELLAVIVILGIIAAIAVPSISAIIQKSKDDAVHAEALQVLNAAKLYVASNNVNDTVILTNDETVTDGSNALDSYLDNPGEYSITINVDDLNNITYTNITATKNDITKTYADEEKLLAKDASSNG